MPSLADVPHPGIRVPILGDLASVNRHTPTQHELHIARGIGPIFQRKLLNRTLPIVAGSDLAEQCCDESLWARGQTGPGRSLGKILGAGLFTAKSSDPLWSHARKTLDPAFAKKSMTVHHRAMMSVADDLCAEWATLQPGESVDIGYSMTRTTLEVISRAGFGSSLGLLGSSTDAIKYGEEFIEALARILVWASQSTNDLPIIQQLRNLSRKRQVSRDSETLHSVVAAVIAKRTTGHYSHASGNTGQDDLLDLMLEGGLPQENITDQILTFLFAGHETTASLLETVLYQMGTNPDLQNAARNEADALASVDYEYSAVTRMRLIRACLDEALRLWPPAPGLFRIARRDQELGGYDVSAGASVFVLSLAAQRDLDRWGHDADTFNPYRTRPRGAYFRPWGVGPRACIGRAFALHEASLVIARALTQFELTTPVPAELTIQERSTIRPNGYTMTVQSR